MRYFATITLCQPSVSVVCLADDSSYEVPGVDLLHVEGGLGWYDFLRQADGKIVGIRFHVSMMSTHDVALMTGLPNEARRSGNYVELLFSPMAEFVEELSNDVDVGFSSLGYRRFDRSLVCVVGIGSNDVACLSVS
jgi:hypothetical protein